MIYYTAVFGRDQSPEKSMPNVYAKKNCPTCQKEHRGRGRFCSQSCASIKNNTGRELAAETKQKIAQKVSEYFRTPEGIATSHMVTRQNTKRHEVNQKIKDGHYILEPEDYYLDVWSDDNDDNIKL